MFFLIIFSLVTLSDPYQTLSSSIVVGKGVSQLTPSKEKLSVSIPIAPVVVNDHNSSSEAANFYKDHTSSETSGLQANHARENASPIIKLASHSDMSRNSVEKESKSEAEKNETLKSSPYSDDESTSPLVLKLDKIYTPLDIAEYIFATGDEKGFVQGVGEMLEDGEIMSSRDDVLLFLEAVQRELANLRRQQVPPDNVSGFKEL